MAFESIRRLFPGIGVEGGGNPNPADDPKPKDDPKNKPKDKGTGDDPGPQDPLASFAAIFDNKPKKKEGEEEDIPLSVAGILTQDTMSKLTENLDFNSFLSDATRDALANGEDPKAVFTAFNEIAKGAYQTALTHSSKLSESIVEDRLKRLEAGLGERINAHQIKSQISSHEAISKSPVLQAGISMIADRLRQAQPDADPKWVTEQATNFFLESAKVLSGGQSSDQGGQGGQPGPGQPTETDWMDFAMGDNPGGDDPTGGESGDR